MLYMVVETFKDKAEIYRRLDAKGRMMPDDLHYISSWIDANFKRCFQLMETENFASFAEWTRYWDDLVDFEIYPVMTSAEAREIALEEN